MDLISSIVEALMPIIEVIIDLINEIVNVLVDLINQILDPLLSNRNHSQFDKGFNTCNKRHHQRTN